MRYLSVCSGIEAATVAFHPLGWRPVAFAENAAFPSAVLAHHYGSNLPGQPLSQNGVPNLGDITRFQEWPDYAAQLVCGGTPCQAFSLPGFRQGLADPRGNLALTFLAVVDRYRPQWVVWENVPGVLSTNGGRDFAAFLGGMGKLGYGWCYRVVDAQYIRVDGFGRAVPQRRRRVFVVGHSGDWRCAAAVLSEPKGATGHAPPRRRAWEDPAGAAPRRAFGGNNTGGPIDVAPALLAQPGSGWKGDFESETFIVQGDYVRRLTPIECERLQGFPDRFTEVPYRGKLAADGPRYQALGNSMAVNAMRWIGRRIELVEDVARELEAERAT